MKINPRQLESMMKQMGMKTVQIDATEVVIKTNDGEIIIENPQVTKVNAMGNETFQITGDTIHRKHDSVIEDIRLIMEKTGASEQEARKALTEAGGDLLWNKRRVG